MPSKARQKRHSVTFLSRRADELIAPRTPRLARRKSSEDDGTDGPLTYLVPNGYSLFFGVTLWVEQGGVLRGYSTTQKSALSLDLTNYRVELVDLFQFHTVFSLTHSFYVQNQNFPRSLKYSTNSTCGCQSPHKFCVFHW